MFPVLIAQQLQDWAPYDPATGKGCVVDGVPTLKCLEVVFNNILVAASALIVIALFAMMVIGGYNYLTSLGNPEKVQKAQNTFKYALIGFILFVSAFLILKIIDYLFLGNQGKVFLFQVGGN
jgi:hypothetical protein